jgi:pimeloyl-ACP methyl ester carboxylesterase
MTTVSRIHGTVRPRDVFFALSILALVSGCLAMGGEEESRFANMDSISERIESFNDVDLHIVEGGDSAGQPVVFIHGTPGSAEFFASYLLHPELQDLRLLALDRPGWGTSLVKNQFDGTLAAQSGMLGEFLCSIKSANPAQQIVVVAHSYGATLTPLLVMDHPQCISAVLLLAGAADPDLAAPRWYNWMTEVPPVSWLASLSGFGLKLSNDEMMLVQSGLELMRDRWSTLNLPVTVIQGETDMLVDPNHADYLEASLAHIPAEIIRFPEAGHMVVHSDRPFVIAQLRKLLQQIK